MRRNNAAFLWMCLAIVSAIIFISRAAAAEAKEITCTGKVIDTEGFAVSEMEQKVHIITN